MNLPRSNVEVSLTTACENGDWVKIMVSREVFCDPELAAEEEQRIFTELHAWATKKALHMKKVRGG